MRLKRMRHRIDIVFFMILLFVSMMTLAQAGTWTRKADMLTPRVGIGVCVLEGKIYAIGGYDSQGKPTAIVEQYDPMTNSWRRLRDMKVARAYPSAVVLDGKIYVIGGENPSGCGPNVSSIERYDPSTDRWTVLMPMPTLGITPAAAVGNKIIAMGGLTAFQCKALPTRSVEQYDPALDRWEDRAKCLSDRYFASACVLDERVYVIGGMLGENSLDAKIIGNVEIYDPAMDKWTKVRPLSKPRAISSATALNGKIFVIGGLVGDTRRDMKSTGSVEIYDPNKDQWVEGTDMPTPRGGLGICAVGNKIYAIGGGSEIANADAPIKWANALSIVEEYIPGSDQRVSYKGKLATTWGQIRQEVR